MSVLPGIEFDAGVLRQEWDEIIARLAEVDAASRHAAEVLKGVVDG
jgi:hypothetical protein